MIDDIEFKARLAKAHNQNDLLETIGDTVMMAVNQLDVLTEKFQRIDAMIIELQKLNQTINEFTVVQQRYYGTSKERHVRITK